MRDRVVDALERALARHGYRKTSVDAVLEAGGLARASFYAHFTSKEDCFLQAYEAAVDDLIATTLDGYRSAPDDDPDARLRAGLGALLTWIASRPRTARLHFVEIYAAGRKGAARRAETMRRLQDLLVCMATQLRPDPAPSEVLHEAVLGSIHGFVFSRLLVGRAGELPVLADALADWVLLVYLGPPSVRRSATRTARAAAAPGER